MAALALVGTMTTGCTSDDLANDTPQAKNDNNTVTLTTTISLDGSATTRALDAQGKKTFAKDDQVAIFYQNTSGETQYVESEELTAADITNNGKTAKFTVTLNNPKAGGQLRYIYPAAMAKSDIAPIDEINDANTISTERLLGDQDGTLETLASKFDLAIYDGNLTDKALLPSTATLKNQLAIAELTIKDYAGNNINNKITKLDIQLSGNDYALTRPATDNPTDGPIYVALYPTPGSDKQNFTVTATTTTPYETYEKDFKFALAANNIYPLSVKTVKVVNLASESLPSEYVAQDGDILTGTLAKKAKISIAANATVTTVTLRDVNINMKDDDTQSKWGGDYAGITCLGNATIILEGTNKVYAFGTAGIQAAHNDSGDEYTLTIKGDGSLKAIGKSGAGIGGDYETTCGNITISGGTITAWIGSISGAAGIGSGYDGICGNIIITGGDIKAEGDDFAAGIGTGANGECGNIEISGGTVDANSLVVAIGCGLGDSSNKSICGNIIIGTGITKVYASSKRGAPPIGAPDYPNKSQIGDIYFGNTKFNLSDWTHAYNYTYDGITLTTGDKWFKLEPKQPAQ